MLLSNFHIIVSFTTFTYTEYLVEICVRDVSCCFRSIAIRGGGNFADIQTLLGWIYLHDSDRLITNASIM